LILGEVAVQPAESPGIRCVPHQIVYFLRGRPDIAEINRLAVFAGTDRFGHQVLEHGAGDGVRDHQWGRSQEVGFDVGMDARLEVAIAGEHGTGDQVVLHDHFLELRIERPALPMQVVQP